MASSLLSRAEPSSAAPAKPRRYGKEQPRVFTPPLRELTPDTSLGFSVIEFATTVLLITLLPWQKWLLIHALELLEDGSFRFRNVIVLVARQNGKSTLSRVLALWWIYVLGQALVLGTAQDLDTAEEVWQGAVDLVEETDDDDVPVRPELAELLDRVVKVNGKKSLNLTTGQRYKVKAASRKAGRGLSGDLILMDELREQQTWAAWGAITKTTMARPDAQIWGLSNAGDLLSVVLDYLRRMAHQALGDPDGLLNDRPLPAPEVDPEASDLEDDDLEVDVDDLGLFEWSAPPGCAVTDRNGWAQANPSMGYTISERTIASAARTDPEPVFRTEVMCQWVDRIEQPEIDLDLWDDLADADSAPASPTGVSFAVAVSQDRTWSCIALAAQRTDGAPHVEIVDNRRGTAWLPARLAELDAKWAPCAIVVDSGSPEGSLLADIEDEGLEVVKPSSQQVGQAFGMFYDAVMVEQQLRHRPERLLDVALVEARTKSLGNAKTWDQRGTTDISPLRAATNALWGWETHGGESAPNIW